MNLTTRISRAHASAELAYEPYAAAPDADEPDWAPYVSTGTGDLCYVGTFACGAVVTEDVF